MFDIKKEGKSREILGFERGCRYMDEEGSKFVKRLERIEGKSKKDGIVIVLASNLN
jgi:hypothetical protein